MINISVVAIIIIISFYYYAIVYYIYRSVRNKTLFLHMKYIHVLFCIQYLIQKSTQNVFVHNKCDLQKFSKHNK